MTIEMGIPRYLQDSCFLMVEDRETGDLKRSKWSVKNTADAVRQWAAASSGSTGISLAEPHIGRGVDGSLWIFHEGVWRPGDREVHEIIVELLGHDYSPARQASVEKYLAGSADLPLLKGLPVGGYLNFRNGLLHWETPTHYGHNPKVLSTVQLACDWNPEATCPRWMQFLSEALPPDAIDTFQEIFGYLLMSGEPLQKAFMFEGSGRNGKGVALHVLETLLGAGNVTHISVQSLGGTRFASAELFGKVANIVGDMSASFVKETDVFKSATGGDSISAERKGRDPFTFTPFASHVFSTNKLPMFADSSAGFLDRWIVVPFPYTCPPEKRDKFLGAKLTEPAELEGIAAWAVVGLRRLMARGRFDLPPSMVEAKDEFAVAVNPARSFLRECAVPSSDDVKVSDLYVVYRAWVSQQSRKGATKNEFYAEIEGLGIQRLKTGGQDVFRGMTLIRRPLDFVADIW